MNKDVSVSNRVRAYAFPRQGGSRREAQNPDDLDHCTVGTQADITHNISGEVLRVYSTVHHTVRSLQYSTVHSTQYAVHSTIQYTVLSVQYSTQYNTVHSTDCTVHYKVQYSTQY